MIGGLKMQSLPSHVCAYKKTKLFDQDNIPKAILNKHSTKKEVWGKIVVTTGRLLYVISEHNNEEHVLSPDLNGIVEPEVEHYVKPMGDVEFYVEFYK
jgi:tellurite resistance-related uncharacterized protein